MGAPLSFAFPCLDEDADPAIIERLMQFVAQAAVFEQRLCDQLFLGGSERRLLAGFGGGDGNNGKR